jgi:catechol 2,3-dioxygenase-like lactoylglutathione lyase family enzyme
MAVQLNHTIVWCRDNKTSAAFLAELLDRPAPRSFGPFMVVAFDNGVSLDFYSVDFELNIQHYAFLVSEEDFDRFFGRIRERNIAYWADPAKTRPGEINHYYGGRGVYFDDPDKHLIELITRPYGTEMPTEG